MIEDIKTKHHFSSGVYARQMELPKGWEAESHKHKFDHLSILSKGEVTVTADGEEIHYTAPEVITIKPGVIHKITAHEDSLWFCIHSTDETCIEEIDNILIEEV